MHTLQAAAESSVSGSPHRLVGLIISVGQCQNYRVVPDRGPPFFTNAAHPMQGTHRAVPRIFPIRTCLAFRGRRADACPVAPVIGLA